MRECQQGFWHLQCRDWCLCCTCGNRHGQGQGQGGGHEGKRGRLRSGAVQAAESGGRAQRAPAQYRCGGSGRLRCTVCKRFLRWALLEPPGVRGPGLLVSQRCAASRGGLLAAASGCVDGRRRGALFTPIPRCSLLHAPWTCYTPAAALQAGLVKATLCLYRSIWMPMGLHSSPL